MKTRRAMFHGCLFKTLMIARKTNCIGLSIAYSYKLLPCTIYGWPIQYITSSNYVSLCKELFLAFRPYMYILAKAFLIFERQ